MCNAQLAKLFLPGSCPISQTQNLREHQGLVISLSFQLDQITPHMFVSKTYPLLTGMFIWSNLNTVMTPGQSPSSLRPHSNTGDSLQFWKPRDAEKSAFMLSSWEWWELFTDIPLSKLGLNYCKAKKLTKDLNTHSIQYATKIIKTKRKLGYHQHNANGTGGVSPRNSPDPHW